MCGNHCWFLNVVLSFFVYTVIFKNNRTYNVNASASCATVNDTWVFDPQFPGICYPRFLMSSSATFENASAHCKNEYNHRGGLPIFHTVEEYQAFQRVARLLIYPPISCADNGSTQLGLKYDFSSFTWLDNRIMNDSLKQYMPPNYNFSVWRTCVDSNTDTWFGVTMGDTANRKCFFRCQIRLDSNPVDISTLNNTNDNCPYGWFPDKSGMVCYFYDSRYLTFAEAESSCASMNSTLPYFETVSEYCNYQSTQITMSSGCQSDSQLNWLGIKPVSVSATNCSYFNANNNVVYPDVFNNPLPCFPETCIVKNSVAKVSLKSWFHVNCTTRHSFFCQRRLSETIINDSSLIIPNSTSPFDICLQINFNSTSSSTMSISEITTSYQQYFLSSNNEPSQTVPEIQPTSKQVIKTQTTSKHWTKTPTSDTSISRSPKSTSTTTTRTSTTSINECEYSLWSSFTACSVTCGKHATRYRTRTLLRSQNSSTLNEMVCGVLVDIVFCNHTLKCNPMTETEQLVAKVLSALGCSYIIASTIISFLCILLLNSFRYEHVLHLAQEFTLCLAHVLIATMSTRVDMAIPCRIASLGILYFFTSNYIFLLMETMQMYYIYTNVISYGQIMSTRYSLAIGFCVPGILVVVVWLCGFDELASSFSCFINWDSNISLFSLFSMMILSIISIVTLESASMGYFVDLPLTDEYQMHAALVSKHALVFKVPLSVVSWFLLSLGLYFQQIAWFPTILAINESLAFCVMFFDLLGHTKVKVLINYMKDKFNCFQLH